MLRQLALCVTLLCGCSPSVFTCVQDSQCGAQGACVMEYCAFPSDACNGGLEFGSLADPDLVGKCVSAPTVGTSSGPSESSEDSTDDGSLTGTADGGSTLGGDTLGLGDSSGTTTTSGTTSSATEGSSTGGKVSPDIVASLATCAFVDPDGVSTEPDPATCLAINAPDAFTVDASATGGLATFGYLVFDLGDGFASEDVVEVALHVRVAIGDNAASIQSGEVHQVAAFNLMSLQDALPEDLGLLARDLGPVGPADEVVWVLPPDLLAANPTAVYLSLQTAANDGVEYWSEAGRDPPRLVVTLR